MFEGENRKSSTTITLSATVNIECSSDRFTFLHLSNARVSCVRKPKLDYIIMIHTGRANAVQKWEDLCHVQSTLFCF